MSVIHRHIVDDYIAPMIISLDASDNEFSDDDDDNDDNEDVDNEHD